MQGKVVFKWLTISLFVDHFLFQVPFFGICLFIFVCTVFLFFLGESIVSIINKIHFVHRFFISWSNM